MKVLKRFGDWFLPWKAGELSLLDATICSRRLYWILSSWKLLDLYHLPLYYLTAGLPCKYIIQIPRVHWDNVFNYYWLYKTYLHQTQRHFLYPGSFLPAWRVGWSLQSNVFFVTVCQVRPLGRPRRRWEDNIKMDLQEVRCGGMDWIDLSQDRDMRWTLVNAVMNLRVP